MIGSENANKHVQNANLHRDSARYRIIGLLVLQTHKQVFDKSSLFTEVQRLPQKDWNFRKEHMKN